MAFEPTTDTAPHSTSSNPDTPSATATSTTAKPFRLKKRKRPTSSTTRTSQSPQPSPHRPRRHHHHHHHHSRHDSHKTRDSSPHQASTDPTDPYIPDPETAFRESLFDAMADDEGAAYWEAVYGQPLHTYSQYYSNNNHDTTSDANAGEPTIHQMTEDEYVDFVRRKMWEKSHGYVFEERARREEERKRSRKSNQRRKDEADEGRGGIDDKNTERNDREKVDWYLGVEAALARGEERRRTAKWKAVWDRYVKGWEGMTDQSQANNHQQQQHTSSDGEGADAGGTTENSKSSHPHPSSSSSSTSFRNRIPWPVETGRYTDVTTLNIEQFFRNVTNASHLSNTTTTSNTETKMHALLKKERVRWHPDKMQQRAGSGFESTKGMDVDTLRTVTAVFQVVDRMFDESKSGR